MSLRDFHGARGGFSPLSSTDLPGAGAAARIPFSRNGGASRRGCSPFTSLLPYQSFLRRHPEGNPIRKSTNRTQSQYRTQASAYPLRQSAGLGCNPKHRPEAPRFLRNSVSLHRKSQSKAPPADTLQREIPPYTLSLRAFPSPRIRLKTKGSHLGTQLFTVSSLQFSADALKFLGTGEARPRSRDTVAVCQRLPEKRGNPC